MIVKVKSKYGKEYEYTYDDDRSSYMKAYYKRKKATLLPKATKRYRDKVTEKFRTCQ